MAEDVVEITYLVSEEARRAPEEFVAEDVPENHVVSEDVGMLTGVTELACVQVSALLLLNCLLSHSRPPLLNTSSLVYMTR